MPDVKRSLNRALSRTTGLRLVRAGAATRAKPVRDLVPARRELRAPVFILSSVRSGSTLLRSMLGSHSALYAPHEMHLGDLAAQATSWFAQTALAEFGIDEGELTAMMWDRLLAEVLRRSGKSVLVEKTPNHVFLADRLAGIWPDARFVFLLRHPGAIHQSWRAARPNEPAGETVAYLRRFCTEVQRCRATLPGLDVRYERLVADPAGETRRLCAFLGVEWEPGMVEYGSHGHGSYRRGLGDWSDNIRSGRPQPARPLPDPAEVPRGLRRIARDWGYLAGPADD
ncbi:sulfotransferase family protein [Actinocatenispora thailandica]|uniref:Sulfotransferase family protein n=1 Tax=Actinocatenispora thailandica TaxID=227318 RepID=A0A7R7DQM0_9ACTN|nr:sulfotransferase [Actinocatenispora thailandica]BCJ35881.1 sulfotransferase family protein [Actinocatenispora thailandica]